MNKTGRSPKPTVEIYSRPGCHLCDEAKSVLTKVRQKYPFDLVETDISQEAVLLKKYGEEIPVIFINSRKAFKFRVSEKEFIKKIQS